MHFLADCDLLDLYEFMLLDVCYKTMKIISKVKEQSWFSRLLIVRQVVDNYLIII